MAKEGHECCVKSLQSKEENNCPFRRNSAKIQNEPTVFFSSLTCHSNVLCGEDHSFSSLIDSAFFLDRESLNDTRLMAVQNNVFQTLWKTL